MDRFIKKVNASSKIVFIILRKALILITLIHSVNLCFSQISVDQYRSEIGNLKSEKQLNQYWDKLYKIDQEILVNTSNKKNADSISTANMVRTALIYEIHGMKAFNQNDFLPILNLSHNNIGQSQIAYWTIIEKCAEAGGVINNFGGKYPAYQLESISLTFYNYSLLNQEQKYQKLLNKLSKIKTTNIVDALLNSLKYQNQLRELNEIKVLNHWHIQSFKNQKEEGKFSLVKMSDDNLYLKIHERIQKLELVQVKEKSKIYRIENEPFGWSFLFGEDGGLSLIDDEEKELIKYKIAK